MTLISVTNTTSSTHGRELEAYERALDSMFELQDKPLSTPTEMARRRRALDAIIDGDHPVAVTAAMRASGRPVRLEPAKTLSDIADRFYGAQAERQRAKTVSTAPAQQRPLPEPAERSDGPATSINVDAVYARWRAPKRAGDFGGIRPAPVKGV
jgi:hypothetical protein